MEITKEKKPEAEKTLPENKAKEEKDNILVNVINAALQVPGIKVDRAEFLKGQFKGEGPSFRNRVLEKGPVKAGCTRHELMRKARKLVNERSLMSSAASFAAGIPGGFAMMAAIPADVMQFYAVALRLAQELAYLYGEGDLWTDGVLDKENVRGQLILYFGSMMGASGATQAVRALSSKIAQELLRKLPQKALTKTIYYPIVKSIAKALGVKMTKEVFAKGVSKIVPVIGGVVSGGITLFTMRPMGMRLAKAFDESHFDYSQEAFDKDWEEVSKVIGKDAAEEEAEIVTEVESNEVVQPEKTPKVSVFDEILKAKKMFDSGVITEQEFMEIKSKLIAEV